MASKDKREMYAEVAETLIAMMREGVAPWSKPWVCSSTLDPNSPHNGSTGRHYRGFNRLYLGMVMHANGWTDPRFVTFNQCRNMGGKVVKGSKGTPVIFNSPMEKKDKATGEVVDRYWVLKRFVVFNAAQVEGIEWEPLLDPVDPDLFDAHDDAQHLADSWFEAEGISLSHGGDRACYSPLFDSIQMPHGADFTTPEHYYQTLFHEMIHSSGHSSRMDRLDLDTFGSENYAKEELVAEIGAAMLYATAGLDRDLMEHSAAYLKAWADRLEDDPGILVTAANAAERAANYVMERVPERV